MLNYLECHYYYCTITQTKVSLVVTGTNGVCVNQFNVILEFRPNFELGYAHGTLERSFGIMVLQVGSHAAAGGVGLSTEVAGELGDTCNQSPGGNERFNLQRM